MWHVVNWTMSAPSSGMRSSAITLSRGAHTPWPSTFNDGLWRMTMVSHGSPGPARTSPQQQLCYAAFRRLLPLKSAKLNGISASYSSALQSNRRKARGHDAVGLTPIVTLPLGVTWLTRLFTSRRQAQGPPTYPWSESALTLSEMPAPSWTPIGMKRKIGGGRPTTAITPAMVGATTPTRTRV